jgi:competence protein ComEC
MTLVNPNVLWDVSLRLGFVAAIGLIVYAEPLSKWTHTSIQRVLPLVVAKRLTFLVSDVLIATLAATLLVLPLVLVHFDQASVVSPLANLLVLPAQSGVIAFGILSTLIGMIVPAVGQVLASVAWLFLTYTIGRVRFLASLPGALVSEAFTPLHVVVIYSLVFGFTLLVWIGPARREALQ